MKNFLKNILLLTSALLLIIYLIQLCVDEGLRNCYTKEPFCTLNLIANGKVSADIAFLGSSRIKKHIDIPMFEKLSQKQAFNLGLDGSNIFLQQVVWDLFKEKNNLPKILFMELDYVRLERDKKVFDKYRFLPYIKYNAVSNILFEMEEFELADKFFPMYKYRSYREYIALGILNFSLLKSGFTNNSLVKNKGFEALNGVLNDTLKVTNTYYINEVDIEFSFSIIRKINDLLQSRGSKLILINSPVYNGGSITIPNEDLYKKRLSKFLNENEITFQDYKNYPPISTNKKYFYDNVHLNKEGASFFTKIIFDYNKSLINEY